MSPGVLLLPLGVLFAERAPFWDRVADPRRDQVDALVARAQSELSDRRRGSPESAARVQAWLREALALDPQSFPAAMLLGEVHARARRSAEAVIAFEKAQLLARTSGEESWSSLRIAVEMSRAGRYPEALAEYDRHIRLGEAQAAAYTNSAEILMALGRLAEAQDRYREAVRLGMQQKPGRERDENLALAFYGLAVALDRDEQMAASREAIARALAGDAKLTLLTDGTLVEDGGSDVFFVPPGDVHYYLGLALAVLGRPAEAVQAFRRFIAEQPDSRYVRRAQAHLSALAAGQPTPGAKIGDNVGDNIGDNVGDNIGDNIGENVGERIREPRLELVAAATVHADESLSAPLVDAAWRSRPGLVEVCLDDIPPAARSAGRIAVEVEFDASGIPRSVALPGRQDWRAFATCLEARLRGGLRLHALPGAGALGSRARSAKARIELVMAVRK